MPKHPGIIRRNGRYYLNVRVPKDLRKAYGKTEIIRKSLGTSDPREAVSQGRYEAFKLESEFAVKRKVTAAKEPSPVVREISDREAHAMVFSWLSEQERASEQWNFEIVAKLDDDEKNAVLDGFRIDAEVYGGGNKHYRAGDAEIDLDGFLKITRVECPKDSPAYRKLLPLFTRARLETVLRNIARLDGETVTAIEPLFKSVYAHTEVTPPWKHSSVGEMVRRFLKALKDGKRSGGTLRTYEVPCRLLKEVLGEKTSVATVTKDQITRLFDLLRKAPSNATKRYRGLTLKQAVDAAEKTGDPHRLGVKTLENYYNNVVAIFNFAVGEEMIAKNPAKDKWLRESLARDGKPKKKALFTAEELNRLFRTPTFKPLTKEDGSRRAKTAHLNTGKAWVPLLSLFHGLRSNEACQLYTEDIKTEDGIAFMEIREERENGSACEKRLKTKQSKRRVPLHPEVVKLGFLAFVDERRKDQNHPRLFQDLKTGATGYFSDAFGKWFGRFVKVNLGKNCKATFHSFRHQFRDALAEAGVPIPDVESLGGWGLINRSSERDYGHGPSLKRLRKQLQKVRYPGLDLTPFYPRNW